MQDTRYIIYRNVKALLLLFSVLISCHRSPVIDFYRERIVIEIRNREVLVNGEYFFRNKTSTGKQIKLYYPFPVDSIHCYPNVIVLDFSYKEDSSGLVFVMGMEGKERSSFKITYNQQVRENHFRYITTTTKIWRKPIQEAEFTIIAPKDLALTMNYKVSKKYRRDDKDYYYLKYDYFFPDEDLLIGW